jgi:hypothetical protein
MFWCLSSQCKKTQKKISFSRPPKTQRFCTPRERERDLSVCKWAPKNATISTNQKTQRRLRNDEKEDNNDKSFERALTRERVSSVYVLCAHKNRKKKFFHATAKNAAFFLPPRERERKKMYAHTKQVSSVKGRHN